MPKKRRPPLTAASARAYVQGGGACCPHCGSDRISGADLEVEEGGAIQEVACSSCHATWRDVYVLAGIDVLDSKGRYVETFDGVGPPGPGDNPHSSLAAEGPTGQFALDVGAAGGIGGGGAWPAPSADPRKSFPEASLHDAGIRGQWAHPSGAGVDVSFIGVFGSSGPRSEDASREAATRPPEVRA